MADKACFFRQKSDGLFLSVKLIPNAKTDAVYGIEHRGKAVVFKARVRAVAEKGQANKALEKLIAKWLGVPKSKVVLTVGGKSRNKTLFIAGDPEDLKERLEHLMIAETLEVHT